jgi:hypothetical protein
MNRVQVETECKIDLLSNPEATEASNAAASGNN